MPLRFDDNLQLQGGGGVMACGPRDANDNIEELCAWVYQRQHDNDAAATEMTTTGGKLSQPNNPPRWEMQLGKVPANAPGAPNLGNGFAIALAVALIRDTTTNDRRVASWSQTVMLT
jgi:hypothetical protein